MDDDLINEKIANLKEHIESVDDRAHKHCNRLSKEIIDRTFPLVKEVEEVKSKCNILERERVRHEKDLEHVSDTVAEIKTYIGKTLVDEFKKIKSDINKMQMKMAIGAGVILALSFLVKHYEVVENVVGG